MEDFTHYTYYELLDRIKEIEEALFVYGYRTVARVRVNMGDLPFILRVSWLSWQPTNEFGTRDGGSHYRTKWCLDADGKPLSQLDARVLAKVAQALPQLVNELRGCEDRAEKELQKAFDDLRQTHAELGLIEENE